MVKKLRYFFLCLLLVASLAPCAAAEVAVAPAGKTLIQQDNLNVTIYTRRASPAERSGCTQSRVTCSLVTNIKILANGRWIFVPRSAFADLSDLRSANIVAKKERYELELFGGDGAEGYTAKIYISKSVDQREILSGLTSSVLQRTQYFEESLE